MRVFCQQCGKLKNTNEKCKCSKQRYCEKDEDHPALSYKWRKHIRPAILTRDDCHCQRCLIKFNILKTDDLQVHHIRSWRDYKELAYEFTNLITICGACNKYLGNKNKLDFLFTPNDLEPPSL